MQKDDLLFYSTLNAAQQYKSYFLIRKSNGETYYACMYTNVIFLSI